MKLKNIQAIARKEYSTSSAISAVFTWHLSFRCF